MKKWFKINSKKLLKIGYILSFVGVFLDYIFTLVPLVGWPELFEEAMAFTACFIDKHGTIFGLTTLLCVWSTFVVLVKYSILPLSIRAGFLWFFGVTKIFAGIHNLILMVMLI